MFFKIGFFKSFAKFVRKHLNQSPSLNNVTGPRLFIFKLASTLLDTDYVGNFKFI